MRGISVAAALRIPRGITALVGAGGKTSLLDRLAGELCVSAHVLRMTTTHICQPPGECLIDPDPAQIRRAFETVRCVSIGSRLPDGRLCGVPIPEEVLLSLADYVLVEADGSRGLPVKAPAAHEPVLPRLSSLVIAVAGMSAIGHPIAQAAHRPLQFAQLSQKTLESPIEPGDLARVLFDPAGGRKGVTCDFAVLLNQADTPDRKTAARAAARLLPCRTVIAALAADAEFCEIWGMGKCLS